MLVKARYSSGEPTETAASSAEAPSERRNATSRATARSGSRNAELAITARSAGCIAIHAPEASRSRPASPAWSRCMWLTSTPRTSAAPAPIDSRPATRASHAVSAGQPVSSSTRPPPVANA